MKVYTGGGDKGTTSLFSGERVAKYSPRLEAYGDVDELNSAVGLLKALLPEGFEQVAEQLNVIQIGLFQAGAWLATMPGSSAIKFLKDFPESHAKGLEQDIDAFSEELPVLKKFILPGGHQAACQAHMVRTICRRCERKIISFAASEDCEGTPMAAILVYFNRLSDYSFVLARFINKKCNTDETTLE
ncbi:MAG: cob(I)yrinic acid a,c-diamide adenosyltransferase [Desulforhopalus sp.]|nr:cob(I)yrinic acid a,c-diamide adenosyltransferase [Desulforhopalus sp.]